MAPARDAILQAVQRGNEAASRAYLADGGDPSAAFTQGPVAGLTLLMAASNFGQPGMVDLLLEHGASLDARASNGMTALMAAAYFGEAAIVRKLLRGGANTRLRNESGLTAMEIAHRRGHAECVKAFRPQGGHKVLPRENVHAAEGMLECKVPEEVWRAAERGREATVEAWVDSGGQMDATFLCDGVDDTTMLMLAAGNGHERLVETFLQRGADLELCDARGKTALQYARQAGHTECAKLIEEQARAARAAKETEAKRRGETPFGGHGGWALSASHHTPGCA